MSNPYAPPEDRPRPEAGATDGDGAPAGHGHGDSGGREGWGGGAGRFGPPADVRPPHPDDVVDVLRRTRQAAVPALAGVLLLLLPMPWGLTSLPFAVVAVVQGVRALRVARRTRVVGPPRATLSLLVFLSAGAVAMTLFSAVMWPLLAPYTRCQQAALTVQAQQTCVDQLHARSPQLGGVRP